MAHVIVKLMEVWRLDSSRRIVVRDATDPNKFCLVSWKTGESTGPMTGKEMFDYLVRKKNPIRAAFKKELNLNEWGLQNLDNYGAIGPNSWVWDEEVPDEELDWDNKK